MQDLLTAMEERREDAINKIWLNPKKNDQGAFIVMENSSKLILLSPGTIVNGFLHIWARARVHPFSGVDASVGRL